MQHSVKETRAGGLGGRLLDAGGSPRRALRWTQTLRLEGIGPRREHGQSIGPSLRYAWPPAHPRCPLLLANPSFFATRRFLFPRWSASRRWVHQDQASLSPAARG